MKVGIEKSLKMLNIAKERNAVKTEKDLSKLLLMQKQSLSKLVRN